MNSQPYDRRARIAADPLVLAGLMLAGLLVVLRLGIYLVLQFPAPLGDGVLFASVARYHCETGRFETPIFPLDPTGDYRYIWHGIGHPALLSVLNPDCSLRGSFVALAVLLSATLPLAYGVVASRRGPLLGLGFALVVFALQAKQGFRPETTVVPMLLAAEWLRQTGRTTPWWIATGLVPWVQPTGFILYVAYVLASLSRHDRDAVRLHWHRALPAVLGLQLLMWWAYPFPISDLLAGLSLQGRQFAARDDGNLFTYFVRSDFFPLFGPAFAVAFLWRARQHRALWLLTPLVWFYGLRVPPAYYNLVPLFVVMLFALLHRSQHDLPPSDRMGALVTVVALLAGLGLLQSNARDVVSAWQYRSTVERAELRTHQLAVQDLAACEVPPWFTLLHPAQRFAPSYKARFSNCEDAPVPSRRDLVPAVWTSLRTDAAACDVEPARASVPIIGRVFRSDSGYSFAVCPAQASTASAP